MLRPLSMSNSVHLDGMLLRLRLNLLSSDYLLLLLLLLVMLMLLETLHLRVVWI